MPCYLRAVLARFFILFAVVFAVSLPSAAQSIGEADSAAMKAIVEAQLDAFAADQTSEAYSFAAPIVQRAFPTVESFMAMVIRGYRPVYRNTSREFIATEIDPNGRPSVRVVLTDENGKRWEALYTMQKQEDGTWKIAGCVLLAKQETEV